MKPKTGLELHSADGFTPTMSTSDEVIAPIGQFYEGCFKCAAEMNSEAASFVRHRIEEDLQLTQKLAQCQTPIDVYNTQVGFCMHMMEDYIVEGQKMFDMARAITMNGDITSGASESPSKAGNGAE